jgi:hypothetical protein
VIISATPKRRPPGNPSLRQPLVDPHHIDGAERGTGGDDISMARAIAARLISLSLLTAGMKCTLSPCARNSPPRSATKAAEHRTLNQAALLRPLPDGVTDLDHSHVRRRDRVGGVIHEYRLVA